jgi:predicted DNA-binding protein
MSTTTIRIPNDRHERLRHLAKYRGIRAIGGVVRPKLAPNHRTTGE